MDNYKRLCKEVLERSYSQILEEALNEWDLVEVYNTNAEKDFTEEFEADYEANYETCLCGHHPIAEVFVLRNRSTGEEIKVGNICIRHFDGGDKWEHIITDYKKVKKDISKRISQTSLDFMRDKKVPGFQSYKFYSKRVNRKITTLSDAELSTIKKVNQLFISFIERTAKDLPKVAPRHEWAYNGITFNSRMAAQWAVYFDVVGIEYEYHGKGIPDFWLPQVEMYASVKGEDFDEGEIYSIDGYVRETSCPVLMLVGSPNYGSYDARLNMDMEDNHIFTLDFVLNGFHGYLWNEGRFFNMAEFSHPPCEENKEDFLGWFDDGKTEDAINKARYYRFG